MKLVLPATSLLFLATACTSDAPEVTDDAPLSVAATPEPVAELPHAPANMQGNATSQPTSRPVSPTDVAVVVNGKEFLEQDVDEQIRKMIQQSGMPVPPDLTQMRPMVRPQALQTMVESELMAQAIAKAGVSATAEEKVAELERNMDAFLLQNNMTREDLAKQIEAGEGISLEEYIKRESESEAFEERFLQIRLVESLYPDRFTMTDEDVAARYERDKEGIFTKPEMVRASHILLGTQKRSPDDVSYPPEEARAKAETVRDLARAEGADFAALAKEHSTGPTGPLGGDLNFFRREQMVPPFSEAAFALEVGQVSDVVETQFGFHVIKVTDKQAARVVPLEEAAPIIRNQMRVERVAETHAEYLKTLRDEAEITYPSTNP